MAFYGYNGDAGECHLTPYFSVPYDYNAFPIQSSISYSSYGYSTSEQIEQSTNYNYYYTTQMHPQLSYSVHNSTEPQLIQYEKAANSLETPYVISNSAKEHDDTLFKEYDPTPYGGGYNMAQTYGKPLSPSNEICYPRSVPKSNGLNGSESFDYGSIPSPYVSHANQLEEPQDQSKEKDEPKSVSGVKEKPILGDDILENPIVPLQQDQDFVAGNGTIEEYGYDYGRQLQQIPYGSGLESMDLCESLFGYWPCLAKQNQRRNLNYINSAEDSSNEQWQSTADYLFGNPFGYGGNGRDERYGNSAYSNQNYYYQQQPYFMSDC
ncbi:PREDICTED: uncharacterized protein LOC109205936 [Nicotiana attenuata]|uniref:Uncharacterized protein n=1 Tax=Nicotiana attenuata TaxID=49451 RepID=A0A314KW58_NICAT|nr:PREDICTED: uncharacterized protein LOC109205936 [Nicotiana attenuata]OIT33502.1 hypothetical protein A4A49_16677 [Nicotiana attenuata]